MRTFSSAPVAACLFSLWIAGVTCAFPVCAIAQNYEVVDLGVNVFPTAINNAGQVVGNISPPPAPGAPPSPHPFIWTNGVLNSFAPAAWSGGVALDIRSDGTVCGQAIFPDGTTAPYVWSNGAVTYLNDANTVGSANATNDSGVVGGFLQDRVGAGYSPTHPFIVENGVLIRLQDLGGTGGGVNGINSVSAAVGNAGTTGAGEEATLWQKVNGAYQLSILPRLGGIAAEATRINVAGQIVGTSDTNTVSSFGLHIQDAVSWQPGASGYAVVDLGGLGGFQNRANDINTAGEIVGFFSDATFKYFAFLYTNDSSTTLDSLAASTGWRFWFASGLNDNGDIVGVGVPPSAPSAFEFHGFVLHPAKPSPKQMIDAIIAKIDGFNINAGVAQSLISKLSAVRDSLDTNRPAACNQLNAFVNEINAQDGKKLAAQQAADLRSAAAALSLALGC